MKKRSSFYENPKNFHDTEQRLKALEQGEKKHREKMDDENRLGVPAYDESVTSDYIRNRVEPPTDMVSGRIIKEAEVKEPEPDEYQKELIKLKLLGPSLIKKLLKNVEEQSRKNRKDTSRGNLMRGYSIDPESLESLDSREHYNVDSLVRFIAGTVSPENLYKIKGRIVSGLIYTQVPGFNIPILKLRLKTMEGLVPKKNLDKILAFIKDHREYLPIGTNNKVL